MTYIVGIGLVKNPIDFSDHAPTYALTPGGASKLKNQTGNHMFTYIHG